MTVIDPEHKEISSQSPSSEIVIPKEYEQMLLPEVIAISNEIDNPITKPDLIILVRRFGVPAYEIVRGFRAGRQNDTEIENLAVTVNRAVVRQFEDETDLEIFTTQTPIHAAELKNTSFENRDQFLDWLENNQETNTAIQKVITVIAQALVKIKALGKDKIKIMVIDDYMYQGLTLGLILPKLIELAFKSTGIDYNGITQLSLHALSARKDFFGKILPEISRSTQPLEELPNYEQIMKALRQFGEQMAESPQNLKNTNTETITHSEENPSTIG